MTVVMVIVFVVYMGIGECFFLRVGVGVFLFFFIVFKFFGLVFLGIALYF